MSGDLKPGASVLDVCCGCKMFYFDKDNPDVLFLDKRRVVHKYDRDTKSPHGRYFSVNPDLLADFRELPIEDNRFSVVIFDPPHFINAGEASYMALKYGRLDRDFRAQIKSGFRECFRVLRPGGILIFKWSEAQISVTEILRLAPEMPLIGQRTGKKARTIWLIYKKGAGAL
jgi:SAM-dependent methyltransferase